MTCQPTLFDFHNSREDYLGLRCKQKRKFKGTTDSRHTLPVAENLLNQQFEATRPKEVWLSDITYIRTEEGWLYLAGHKDLFTGEIVGYVMSNRITGERVDGWGEFWISSH